MSPGIRWALGVVFVSLLFFEAAAQPIFPPKIPLQGRLNALVILVQYAEDDFEHCVTVKQFDESGIPSFSAANYDDVCRNRPGGRDGWEPGAAQSWTDDPETEWPANGDSIDVYRRKLPKWAEGTRLIDEPGSQSVTEGSLTDFYNTVSGGRFDVRGVVWPYVYVPELPESAYLDAPGPFTNGVVRLSHEIVSYVAQNPEGLPLDDETLWDLYKNGEGADRTPDGIFDCILLVYRFNGFRRIVGGSGISSFGTAAPGDPFEKQPIFIGKLQVTGGYPSGSGLVNRALTLKDAVKMIAHELGHRHFGPHVATTFDVMGLGPYNFFGARNRMEAGWANVRRIDLSDIVRAGGRLEVELGGLKSGEIIRISDGQERCGDLVIEARLHDNFWDRPADGRNADGDFSDPAIPIEGLFLHKTNGPPCRNVIHFSSLENTGLPARSKSSFMEGVKEPLRRLAFGEGDAYTPFSTFPFHVFAHETLDSRIAITDIRRTDNGFAFTLWSDYAENPWEIYKTLKTNYSFDGLTVARNKFLPWKMSGTWLLEEGLQLSSGTRLALDETAKLFVPPGKPVNIRCNDGRTTSFVSSSRLLSWLRIKKLLVSPCLEGSVGTLMAE